MTNQNLKQNKNLVSSESITEIIVRLVEDYGLDKEIEEEEEVKKRLVGAENFLQKQGIKFLFSKKIKEQLEKGKNLDEIIASRKLRKVIGELSKNNVSAEKLTADIQKSFGLPKRDAERLTKELQKIIPLFNADIPSEENILEKKEPTPKEPLIEKRGVRPKEKDIYKEPIE